MSHEKRASRTAGRLTALASAVALALGTLSLAGCGNDDDELPPVEEERPATEEQGSPMQDTTDDPGIDQTNTASGDGSAEPISGTEENAEGPDDVAPEEDPLPEAEQEPVPGEEPDGQQSTMNPDEDEEEQ
ncbi:hypothetical protein ACOJCM_09825 [Billgrantia sp. LNSP4103-1]|uniref:hypothetical protein n=1 Tax=Billgrantia sp. LNSP4103-1 TaxID=3410266 RepID=UPI00403F7729